MKTTCYRLLGYSIFSLFLIFFTAQNILAQNQNSSSDQITEGSLEILDSKGVKKALCPLKHTSVKAEISGFINHVNVTQEFENPLSENIEAVYVFPLSQNAVVDEMTIHLGDRIVKGKIKRREEASAIYKAAREAGKVAALLDQERPNIFTQYLANIAPGSKIKINISYVEVLKYEDGEYEFVFPMVVGERYVPASQNPEEAARINSSPRISNGMRTGHTLSIELSLDAGLPIEAMKSILHEVDMALVDRNKAIIKLKDNEAIPNKDFIFKYKVAGEKIKDALLTHSSSKGNFFTLILQPPERFTREEVTPKELIFVLDTSGSMSGFPIEKAKETMLLALEGLYPQDTFNLITFSGDTHILFSKPLPATSENLSKAKNFLKSRKGNGGTEMMKAIQAALDPSDSQDHLRIVCFMTDGYVGNDNEIIAEVQKHPNARVFAFGIGDSVNRFLLDKMALYGNGEVEYVSTKDDGSAAAKRFHERLRNPLLTNISIDWNNLPVTDIFPKKIPDLFSIKPVVIFGRYNGEATGVCQLKGNMAGQPIVRDIPIQLPLSSPHHQAIAHLWARARIDELMNSLGNLVSSETIEKTQLQEEITLLGLTYHLLTQFTSFVAVEEKILIEPQKPLKLVVPLESTEHSTSSQVTSYGVNEVCVLLGEEPLVNTYDANISTTYHLHQINELPINGRSFLEFSLLTPGIVGSNTVSSTNTLIINGQLASNFQIDGTDNRDDVLESAAQNISKESIEELQITTNSYSANSIRASGAINVITKSGTNEFHGSAYENNRTSALAANDIDNKSQFTKLEKNTFTSNEFGYSIGGPLKKDKSFIFHNGEFKLVHSMTNNIFVAPTLDLLSFSSQNTQDFFRTFPLSTTINGQIFTVSEILSQIPIVAKSNKFAQLPKNLPAFGQIISRLSTNSGAGNPQTSFHSVSRFDQNFSSKINFSAQHVLSKEHYFDGTVSASPYQGFSSGQERFHNNFLTRLVYVPTPKLVLDTKLFYSRLTLKQALGQQPINPTLLATSSIPEFGGHPITFPGYLPTTTNSYQSQVPNSIPTNLATNLLQVSHLTVYVKGVNAFSVGGEYRYSQDNRNISFSQRATEILGANLAEALNNLVTGQLNSYQVAVEPKENLLNPIIPFSTNSPNTARTYKTNQFSLYGQDSIRVTNYLTIDLGLRYDYFGVPSNKNKQLDSNFYYGQGTNLAEQFRNGNIFLANESPIKSLYRKDKNNFSPKIGVAWDITKNGKASLRAGYSINYIPLRNNNIFNLAQNLPTTAIISLTKGVEAQNIPITPSNFGALTNTLAKANLSHIDENLRIAYSHNYSASFESLLFSKTLFSIEYSGAKGSKLYSLANFNRPGYGRVLFSDPSATSRINNKYANIYTLANEGFFTYNRLTLSLTSPNLANIGFLVNFHYSLSHAIDNIDTTKNGFITGFLDPFNPSLDKGSADFDVRHKVVFDGVWSIPFFNKTGDLKEKLLKGYEIAYVFTAISGTPFSIYDCSNSLGIGCSRVSLSGDIGKVTSSLPSNQPNLFNYLNLNTPAIALGFYHNPLTNFSDIGTYPANISGRNIFHSPGNWQLDASISKITTLHDHYKIIFRAEAYNLFNHSNLHVLTNQLDASQTNFVPAKRFGNRQIQLSLKLAF